MEDKSPPSDILSWASTIQAIAQNGLTFAKDPFDWERYQTLLNIAKEMFSTQTTHTISQLDALFEQDYGYATPKLDVRGAVFVEGKLLLVKERSDGLWTLPGGWCDVNVSPQENIEREIFEEAGIQAKAIKLIGLFDKQKQDYPPQLPHAYKAIFLCEYQSGEEKTSLETADVGYFGLNDLPKLSEHRVSIGNIQRCFAHFDNKELVTEFD